MQIFSVFDKKLAFTGTNGALYLTKALFSIAQKEMNLRNLGVVLFVPVPDFDFTVFTNDMSVCELVIAQFCQNELRCCRLDDIEFYVKVPSSGELIECEFIRLFVSNGEKSDGSFLSPLMIIILTHQIHN